MANIKSQIKRNKTNEKARQRNASAKSAIRTSMKKVRLAVEAKDLAKHGYDNDGIATELNINPIRAKILRKNSMVISQKRINQTLEDLYQLDLQIKSGLVDRFYSFEIFLINFKRN